MVIWHKDKKYQRCALLVAMILHQALTTAEIYKWTDERGQIHFGDRPEGQQAEQVDIKNKPSSIDDDYEQRIIKQNRLLEVIDEERQQQKQTADEAEETQDKRQANCAIARTKLEGIQNSSFLYVKTDDPDNPKILDEKERSAELTKAGNDVRVWCD